MISKTSTFTLKALALLAGLKPGERVGTAALAKSAKAPAHYLSKVLQSLAVHKIVVSRNGLHGGFMLVRDPVKISLYDVVSVTEDLSRMEGCFMGGDRCSHSRPCILHNRWHKVRKCFIEFLKATTIKDIMR